jgi:hypothetical protein
MGHPRKGGAMSVHTEVPHPHAHALERLEHRGRPVKTADVMKEKVATRFNSWLAFKITDGVGTMWCAYVFALIAFVSLPAILIQTGWVNKSAFPHFLTSAGLILVVAWIAQTFLQLVLLSIIIVGQNIAAAASDKRAENTYKDAEAILKEAIEIQKHLQAQDEKLIGALNDALSKPPAP